MPPPAPSPAGSAPDRGPACFSSLPCELQAHIIACVWATVDGPALAKGVQPVEGDVFECLGSLALVSRRMSELVAPLLWKVSPPAPGARRSRPRAGPRELGDGPGPGPGA